MTIDAVAAGSLSFLEQASLRELLELTDSSDVVLMPTAAAFIGATAAAVAAAHAFELSGARVEALMVADRASANETYFAQRIAMAQWVVLLDGSALHARSTWRDSAVGEALRTARLIGIGETATVMGDEMIDPRGGAPTTGLGYRSGAVLTTNSGSDQLARTRDLLGDAWPLIVLDDDGVVLSSEGTWCQWGVGGVYATLGRDALTLKSVSSQ